MTPGHELQHQTMVLAAKQGHTILCPRCGIHPASLGPIDTRAAEAQIQAMTEAAIAAESAEFSPIIRNRHLYPDWPDGWAGISFATLDRDEQNERAITFAEAWASAPEGAFVLSGETGVGKSYICAAIATELLGRGLDISAWEWLDWRDTLIRVFRQDASDEAVDAFKRRMSRCAVLILDDVAAETTGRGVREMFESVIHARWSANLATLITTNASEEAWTDWSARSYSRLRDKGRSMWVPMAGEDRRRRVAA